MYTIYSCEDAKDVMMCMHGATATRHDYNHCVACTACNMRSQIIATGQKISDSHNFIHNSSGQQIKGIHVPKKLIYISLNLCKLR